MHGDQDILPMIQPPSSAQAARAVLEARQMYARTLSGWACDVLALRRAGLQGALWNHGAAHRWRKAA